MSRPSYVQMERLVQFLEDNPGIAKGHLCSAHACRQTKLKWEEISNILNSLGGTIKDAKAWAKLWADKKYALKRIIAQRNASVARTGGGVEKLPSVSEWEERIIAIMGGSSFAEGDQELSVPLFVTVESENPQPQLPDTNNIIVEENSQVTNNQRHPSTSQASAPSTPRRTPSVRSRRLFQSRLNLECQRLIRIEERRVEAEVAHAAEWCHKSINQHSKCHSYLW